MRNVFYYLVLLAGVCLLMGCENKQRTRKIVEIDTLSTPQVEEIIKPTVNVYIENSGSMDGYVKGVTEFEQAVYNYLSDVKIAKVTDSLNLYYINSEIIPQGTVYGEMDVLKDFIEKLEPSSFRMRGGNRGTSDIAEVIKLVVGEIDEHTISVLITDGIFSPGRNKSAGDYLNNQQIGIKNTFATFLDKEKDAAVVVYQLSSMFDGTYYNLVDATFTIREQRPFYMWVIGSNKHLVALRRAIPDDKFKGSGVQNVFSVSTGGQKVKYAIKPGKFSRKKIKDNIIEDLKKDKKGLFKFTINVDFSQLLLDKSYLVNLDNYENNSRYELDIKPYTGEDHNYTHALNFSSERIHKGSIIVRLKVERPTWIDEVNDDEGTSAVSGKTYGIKNQINGVFDAFTFNDKSKYYTEIKIDIN